MDVSVCLQRCLGKLEVYLFSCYLMAPELSPALSAGSLDLTLGPWMGMCLARGTLSHGTRYSSGS